MLISALDDIAYLLNLRGKDIPCNPVFMSYLFLSKVNGKEQFTLYINSSKLSKEIKDKLNDENILVKPYNKIYKDVEKFDGIIYCDYSIMANN